MWASATNVALDWIAGPWRASVSWQGAALKRPLMPLCSGTTEFVCDDGIPDIKKPRDGVSGKEQYGIRRTHTYVA